MPRRDSATKQAERTRKQRKRRGLDKERRNNRRQKEKH